MVTRNRRLKNPRALGVACAATATGLGLLYMAAAGAPTLYFAVNALSLVLGLALFAVLPSTGLASRLSGGVLVALGSLLLATALFGVSVEGASRWIHIAGLSLQISLVVLPAMLVAFARGRGLLATVGMILAAVALALQPDRAMAGVLAAALAVLALYRPDRWVVSTLAVAVAGFATTLTRPDSLPAVPYVDQILYTSFQVHMLAGLAVVGGALLLIVPAIAGQWMDPGNREVHAVFGMVWLGVVVAAALGNYPTPLVGYGGSAVLGYALSLSFVPGRARSVGVVGARAEDVASTDPAERPDLRMGVEYGDGSPEHLHPSV
jgi:cell division protein FtsW (lipid II flippase)